MLLLRSSGVSKLVARCLTSNMDYTEIKIPVPWGEIAGKWWGSQKQKPILTLHGWQVRIKNQILRLCLSFLKTVSP